MLFLPNIRRTIARGLFGLFALLLLNGIVFRHAHQLADGRIITHAHPFWPDGKGPVKPNTHTAGELALLDSLSQPLLTLTAPLTYCFVALAVGYVVVFFGRTSPLRSARRRLVALRGPPVPALLY
jgi:hypothetical protein